MEEEEAMNSPDGQSAPPVVPPPRFEMGSSEAPPSTGASEAPPRMLHPTDEATGVPAMAAPPVTDPAPARPDQPPVPAGLRWTATEGGTYGVQDPTMTICTKEAWGDIMSMFSGGLAAETEAEAKRAKKAAEAPAPVAKAPSPAPVVRAPPPAVADEDAFAIYEDTCLIPANAAAAVAEKAATENANAFEGLDIREDTVVIPQNAFAPAATPAAAASTRIPLAPTPASTRIPLAPTPASTRIPLAPTPASTRIPLAPTPASVRPPLAPRAAMPPPASVAKTPSARAAGPCDENATPTQEITLEPHPLNVTAGEDSPTVDVPSGPRAPANTPDQAGLNFDVYQDTVLVDPAAVNAAGVGSRASVAPSQATTRATDSGEPSEGDTENTAPAGTPLVDLFEPRHIADAAAATAALQPLSKQRAAALDMLTTIPSDENARRAAEETLRTAQPPPELAGEDAFEVFADDDETAQIPVNRLVTTLDDAPEFR
jgi:checkpoint serine/threonine-protein kinase